MISLAELSKKNPLFNDDLYISVSELIEVITNHSDGNEDDVITYLVQGLDADSILVHQKTITIGYHDINHDFIVFLTDDELEPLKFTELSNKFDLSNHYLPKNELAKVRNIEQLNIELLSDFNCERVQDDKRLGDSEAQLSYIEVIQKLEKENDQLRETLAQNNTELSLVHDWQSMESYIYPPELHIAIIMWEKMYVSDEIASQHLTKHSDRFRNIAIKMGLTKDSAPVALIERLQTITTPQDKKLPHYLEKLNYILDSDNHDT